MCKFSLAFGEFCMCLFELFIIYGPECGNLHHVSSGGVISHWTEQGLSDGKAYVNLEITCRVF